MTTRVREWIWKDPIKEPYGERVYIKPRELTEADRNFMHANFHALLNQPYDREFLTRAYAALRILEVPGLDWWYKDSTMWFTHEHDKVLVYLTMK